MNRNNSNNNGSNNNNNGDNNNNNRNNNRNNNCSNEERNNVTISGNQVIVIVNDQVADLNSLLNGLAINESVSEPQHNGIELFIPRHPMSNNYMYDFAHGGRRTAAYNNWIRNLDLDEYLPAVLDGVDTTRPMKIEVYYGYMARFDMINFQKAIVDQLSTYYGFDDNLFWISNQYHDAHVNSYEEGYMRIRIENI